MNTTKLAGYWSEYAGMALNPLNWYGGNPIGGVAALTTPTRNLKEQAVHDNNGWGQAAMNVLVPGVGAYHSMKRLGTSIRGPELKALREEDKEEKAQADADRKEEARQRVSKNKAVAEKAASALLGGIGGGIGGAAAGGMTGAGLGALATLLGGKEDEEGNKAYGKNMLLGAGIGAAGMGTIGALGGALGGHALSESNDAIADFRRRLADGSIVGTPAWTRKEWADQDAAELRSNPR